MSQLEFTNQSFKEVVNKDGKKDESQGKSEFKDKKVDFSDNGTLKKINGSF